MPIDTTGGFSTTSETTAPQTASDILNDIPGMLGIAGEDAESPDELAEVEATETEAPETEGAEAPDASTAADTAASEAAEGEATEEVSVEAPEKKLATEFAVFDGEGELEIPDLTIKFKASGEEREMPLDKVVKLAQQGFYNEEREQQVREFREALPQWQQAVTERDQMISMYADAWERVLTEASQGKTDTLERELQNFLDASSPESRARRAEARLQDIERQGQLTHVERQAQQFTSSLLPKFEALASQAPDVGEEAIIGRFNLLVAPLMVRGQVPPQRFAEVARLVDAELVPWVEAQQDARTRTKAASTAEAQRQAAIAADAKRKLSRVTRPQGAHTPEAQMKKPRPPATASDILSEDSLRDMVTSALERR